MSSFLARAHVACDGHSMVSLKQFGDGEVEVEVT